MSPKRATKLKDLVGVWLKTPKTVLTDSLGYQTVPNSYLKIVQDPTWQKPPIRQSTIQVLVCSGTVLQHSGKYFSSEVEAERFFGQCEIIPSKELEDVEKYVSAQRLKQPWNFVSLGSGPNQGSDPEIFAVDKKGVVIPAFDWLPSEKDAGDGEVNRYTSIKLPYWDGFQAEFKIGPASCLEVLTTSIRAQIKNTQKALVAKYPDAHLVGHDVLPVPAEIMAKAKKAHVALGCAPSFNAYDMHGEKPHDGRELPFRFAGCHYHITLPANAKKSDIPSIIKQMDNLAGVVSVAVLAGLENPLRRKYYGLAGEYRLPNYGLEYRTLSSAVLWHPTMIHLLFELCRSAVQLAVGNFQFWEGSQEETIDIINNLDVDQARKAIKRNRDIITALVSGRTLSYGKQVVDGLILKGLAEHVPMDVEKNWQLGNPNWGDYGRGRGIQLRDFVTMVLKK